VPLSNHCLARRLASGRTRRRAAITYTSSSAARNDTGGVARAQSSARRSTLQTSADEGIFAAPLENRARAESNFAR
jgi:hypothetical protein